MTTLSNIQLRAIQLFEQNLFLQNDRQHLPTREARLVLHDQFVFFIKHIHFNFNYKSKSYQEALDLYNILHILDIELVVKMGVHFNLWGESVYRLGTEKHYLEYCDKTTNMEILGCFAMTEIGHGSNIAKLETTATYTAETREFVIHSPTPSSHKFWIGHSAVFAHYTIVFAQLYIDSINYGVHPFIVQLRIVDTGFVMDNITIRDCGQKSGLNSIDNGEISFNHVRIPYDNLLDKFAQISNDGVYSSVRGRLSKMFNELSKNRFGLGTGCNVISRYYLKRTLEYSLCRTQFGPSSTEIPILTYPTHHERLFPLLAKAILLLNYTDAQRAFIEDRTQCHKSSMISKTVGTSNCLEVLQVSRECCGGHGFHFNSGFGKMYRHVDIYTTFEGDNTVLLQQLFQIYLKQAKHISYRGVFNYECSKYYNTCFGELYDPMSNGVLDVQIFCKNLDYIINYKVLHILFLLNNAGARDSNPFNTWTKHLNEIIRISKLICVYTILSDTIHKDVRMDTPLLELFIWKHVQSNLDIYSQMIAPAHTSSIPKYIERIYQLIYTNIEFYIHRLRAPTIHFLEERSHLHRIAAKI
tara:strand:- start:7952 stop:9700 length:1749 start_codon:yes stop_codon:yes gene_type:complete